MFPLTHLEFVYLPGYIFIFEITIEMYSPVTKKEEEIIKIIVSKFDLQ